MTQQQFDNLCSLHNKEWVIRHFPRSVNRLINILNNNKTK
ncbi:hypothetical protein HMPREF1860_00854 [Prevotella amnii]|uniref:Uncharacterized protein n=1 Tax=Prevotella amnii TaxID=419005 RepID=A0A134BFL3_9BACT|nr:hypothetical protein HMPREF1860_00854 [Prevotella amnii]